MLSKVMRWLDSTPAPSGMQSGIGMQSSLPLGWALQTEGGPFWQKRDGHCAREGRGDGASAGAEGEQRGRAVERREIGRAGAMPLAAASFWQAAPDPAYWLAWRGAWRPMPYAAAPLQLSPAPPCCCCSAHHCSPPPRSQSHPRARLPYHTPRGGECRVPSHVTVRRRASMHATSPGRCRCSPSRHWHGAPTPPGV